MVTKRQQLEFAAKHIEKWKSGYDFAVVEKATDGYLYVRWPSVCASGITKKEWRQERDKMQKKAQQAAQPVQDNSWYERGEFPPVGCECEVSQKSGGAWIKAAILAVTNQNVIMLVNDDPLEVVSGASNVIFRPLRTWREKAIDDMVSVILDYDGYMITSATAELVARQLHDSGYHK